jgi:hypothetical protein
MFCVGSVRVVLPAEFGTASGPLAVAVAPRFEPLPDGISELIEQGVDPRSNPRLDIEPAGFGRLRIYVIEPEAKDVPLDVRSPCASWWTGTFRNGMLAGVTGLPVGVDSRLWIRTTVGCIDFLYDAARTSPGRMEAYCPHEHHSYSVSKYEIVEMPDESAIWVDGFLAGNAPPIHEMFGRSIYGDDVDLADPRVPSQRALASHAVVRAARTARNPRPSLHPMGSDRGRVLAVDKPSVEYRRHHRPAPLAHRRVGLWSATSSPQHRHLLAGVLGLR